MGMIELPCHNPRMKQNLIDVAENLKLHFEAVYQVELKFAKFKFIFDSFGRVS